MRIAVTGASGFVGGALATALADDGHLVTGFGRRPHGWQHPRGNYVIWDLGSAAPDEAHHIDAVVHCAALADDWAPRDTAMRSNLGGTRRVLETFAGCRFVHMSTSSVYDAFRPSVMARENEPAPHRHLSSYPESKAAAERLLAGTDAVILRPHAVYGPGDTTLLPRLLQSVRHGRLVLPAGAQVRHSLTHIDNLTQAVRCALDPDGPSGVFNIADAEPVYLAEVITEFLARADLPARIIAIPFSAAWQAARFAELRAALRHTRPRLTRYAVSQLGVERTFDIAAARRQLGYRPFTTTLSGAEAW